MDNDQLFKTYLDYLDGKAEDPMLDEEEYLYMASIVADNEDFDLLEEILEDGLKHHPKSDQIRIRKAFAQLDIGDLAEAKLTAAPVPAKMTLRRLFNVRYQTEVDRNGAQLKHLNEAVKIMKSGTETLTEDEIIQFFVIAEQVKGCYPVVKKNLKMLRQRCDYMPTLLWEMVHLARNADEQSDVGTYLEELTMLEPVEIRWWDELAIYSIQLEDIARAREAIDYALSINASHIRTRIINAQVMVMEGADTESIVKAMGEEALMSSEYNGIQILMLAPIFLMEGRNDELERLLTRYIAVNPEAFDVATMLYLKLKDKPKLVDNLLHRQMGSLIKAQPDDDDHFLLWLKIEKWADRLFMDKKYDLGAKVLKAFERYSPLEQPYRLFEMLYLSGNYEELVGRIIKTKIEDDMPEVEDGEVCLTVAQERVSVAAVRHFHVLFMLVMSSIRVGENPEPIFAMVAEEIDTIKKMHETMTFEGRMPLAGIITTFDAIKRGYKRGTNPDKYDPFLPH